MKKWTWLCVITGILSLLSVGVSATETEEQSKFSEYSMEQMVEEALTELEEKWTEMFDTTENVSLEIKNTRVLSVCENVGERIIYNDETMEETFPEICVVDSVVEFVIFVNFIGEDGIPELMSGYNTVAFFKDGSTLVMAEDVFSRYRKRSFDRNMSGIIDRVTDLGASYNRTILLKHSDVKEETDEASAGAKLRESDEIAALLYAQKTDKVYTSTDHILEIFRLLSEADIMPITNYGFSLQKDYVPYGIEINLDAPVMDENRIQDEEVLKEKLTQTANVLLALIENLSEVKFSWRNVLTLDGMDIPGEFYWDAKLASAYLNGNDIKEYGTSLERFKELLEE